MKKNRLPKKAMSIILSTTIVTSIFPNTNITAAISNAELETQEIVTTEDWENTKIGEYPLDIASDNWQTLSYSETVQACNMSDEILDDYSTKELAKYVLEYPLLVDMFCFDNISDGILHLKETSNIMQEYFSRKDAIDVLLKEYDNLSVDYSQLLDASESNPLEESNYDKELFLQGYFATEYNNLNNKQINKLVNTLEEKFDEKEGLFDTCSSSLLFYETLQEENGNIPLEAIPENIYDSLTTEAFEDNGQLAGYTYGSFYTNTEPNYNIGVYTKYGKSVGCLRWVSGDYSVRLKEALKSDMEVLHPNWTFLGYASPRYNCHSYAWISSSANSFWLNNPDIFANSNSFKKIANSAGKRSGDKVIIDGSSYFYEPYSQKYTKALHSVIMTNSINCKSKLGNNGTYKPPLNDMISFYQGTSTRIYRAN